MSNRIRNTLAITWKELLVILKDRGLMAVILLLPLLFSTMLSIVNENLAGDEEGGGITLAVSLVNEDDGPYGQQVENILGQILQLDITKASSASEVTKQVSEGKLMAAIIIPAGFSKQIDDYEPSDIEVIIDPVQKELASLVTGLVNYAVSPVTIQGELQHGIRATFEDSGVLEGADPELVAAAEAQTLGVIMTQLQEMQEDPFIAVNREDITEEAIDEEFNPWNLIVPGFTVMFAFFLTGHIGGTYHKEREAGTFRRLLAAPLDRASIISGPMLAYLLIVCFQVVVLFGLSAGIFGMELGDSIPGLIVVTIALGLVVATMGLMIGVLSRSGNQADTVGTLLAFVLALVGGALPIGTPEPLYKMGGVLGFVSNLAPQAHAAEGFRLLLFDAGTAGQVWLQVGILLAFAVFFFGIAVWHLKFE